MYNLTEENELIALAQQGSTAACEKLLAAYAGLLKNMRHRYAHTPTGKILSDDMQGILHLAFIEAIHSFEPARGIHFAAFLQSRRPPAKHHATGCKQAKTKLNRQNKKTRLSEFFYLP